tara:strand:+ start:249 stop:950 length:702 start_codon:yes stop_codon:yes gene_type:complete
MKVLAIIPARGGSKSVPRKNIANFAGQPLISFTIQEALKTKKITDLVVSSDDEEIISLVNSMGILAPFKRPPELATDQAESAPVIKHCLEFMEKFYLKKYDAVLMLQPTSPLRNSNHIDNAIEMMIENDCDSVVSIVSVNGYHPFRMKRKVGNQIINYIDQGFEDMRPRQVLPKVFIRNGAIYLSKRQIIMDQNKLVGEKCLGMEMSSNDSINIDDPIDFKLAEMMLLEKKND